MVLLAKSHSKKFSRVSNEVVMSQNYNYDNVFFSPTISQIQFVPYDKTAQTLPEIILTAPNTISTSSKNPSAQGRPSQPLQNQAECEPLKLSYATRDLIDILRPEIFSQADPFRYLIDKTMKIPDRSIPRMIQELNELLDADQLPRCYIPYASTLFSLLRCWPDVEMVKRYISCIQRSFHSNEVDLSFLPSNIPLSPLLLELFSADIFTDPIPPLRLFYKLLNMPSNDIINLATLVQEFVQRTIALPNISFSKRYYIWYADDVRKLLQNQSALNDLKRDIAVIKRIATSGQPFLPSTSMT